ncbi:TniQ family protein [Muricoccus pecuniae]|uniref:TniQ domain-containing protein n=1 Tax=Muricoccus pecuniae TaxID=693023 RepID=A0A840YHV6_9PROT|nr:TniQ family protein [Roseomonas pecuniae]MBB5693573.1 hypothetical protein [Roseomonas pecuniae]
MKAQPLLVQPHADESALGLIARLAQANLCTVTQMLWWLDLPEEGRAALSASPAAAAGLLDLDPGVLERMGFEVSGQTWVLGERVPAAMVVKQHMRLCPDCLREEPYHRRVWDLLIPSLCPRHGKPLIDRCPGCKTFLRWRRLSITSCACGQDLRTVDVRPVSHGCLGAAAVYDRLGIRDHGSPLPEPFRSLPLKDLVELLCFLGRTDIVLAQGNPHGLRGKSMSLDPMVLDAGVRVAVGWPASFSDLAIRLRRVRGERRGFQRQYGYLHRFIAKCGKAAYGPWLRAAYRDHLLNVDGVPSQILPSFLCVAETLADFVTASEAQKMLSLSTRQWRRLRRSALWRGLPRIEQLRATGYLLRRSDVEALARLLPRLIGAAEANRMLGLRGVRGSKVDGLAAYGFLTVYDYNPLASRWKAVDRAEVEGLFWEIASQATSIRPPHALDFDALYRHCSNGRVPPLSFADIISGLVEGRVRGYTVDRSRNDLRRFVFDATQAYYLLRGTASCEVG